MSLTQPRDSAAKPQADTQHHAMLRQLLGVVSYPIWLIANSLNDPGTRGCARKPRTKNPKDCVIFVAAEQKQGREHGGDDCKLHSFNAKIETEQAHNAIPAGKPKFVQRRSEGQSVDESKEGRDGSFASGEERTQRVDRGYQDRNGNKHLDRPAGKMHDAEGG